VNLLLFNLATDADDPILGFTTRWINGLAMDYEHIDVITMRTGNIQVWANVRVYSVGKERGYGDLRRLITFYALLSRLLFTRRYDACFAHMMPLFAILAAPLLFVFRVPITLWYTHRTPHRQVKWAMRVSRRVVTAVADSFPFATPKLRVIGHGIDTAFFHLKAAPRTGDPLLVQVGRLMPVKRQHEVITAVATASAWRLRLIGGTPPDISAAYADGLHTLAHTLNVTDRVQFDGAQSMQTVRDAYQDAWCAVNLSPSGMFDKAALESMACGVPTFVTNPAFDAVLGDHAALLRLTAHNDSYTDALIDGLQTFAAMPQDQRVQIGAAIRARVIDQHSIYQLMPRLISILNTGEPA
jgi:glycosyltransferase involved in cell wall biosynthesis